MYVSFHPGELYSPAAFVRVSLSGCRPGPKEVAATGVWPRWPRAVLELEIIAMDIEEMSRAVFHLTRSNNELREARLNPGS